MAALRGGPWTLIMDMNHELILAFGRVEGKIDSLVQGQARQEARLDGHDKRLGMLEALASQGARHGRRGGLARLVRLAIPHQRSPLMAAQPETLNDLHEQLAQQLLSMIRGGDASAAVLNVARQFLKDNNIDADAKAGLPLKALEETLGDFDEDDPDNVVQFGYR
jgi:hypothetical protein